MQYLNHSCRKILETHIKNIFVKKKWNVDAHFGSIYTIETLQNEDVIKEKKTTDAKNNIQFFKLHCQTLEERRFKIPVET